MYSEYRYYNTQLGKQLTMRVSNTHVHNTLQKTKHLFNTAYLLNMYIVHKYTL